MTLLGPHLASVVGLLTQLRSPFILRMQRPTVVPYALDLGYVVVKRLSYTNEFWNFMIMQSTVEWRIMLRLLPSGFFCIMTCSITLCTHLKPLSTMYVTMY